MVRSNHKPYVIDPEVVHEWVRRSCEAQGVPVKITDPEVIRRIVILFRPEASYHLSKGQARTKRDTPSQQTDGARPGASRQSSGRNETGNGT